MEARLIAGTEGALNPFFSPDGQWIGFVAAGKLKKVSISGGAVRTLCDAAPRGATWGANDTIVFTPTWAVLLVSPQGRAQPLTNLVEETRAAIGAAVLPTAKNLTRTGWVRQRRRGDIAAHRWIRREACHIAAVPFPDSPGQDTWLLRRNNHGSPFDTTAERVHLPGRQDAFLRRRCRSSVPRVQFFFPPRVHCLPSWRPQVRAQSCGRSRRGPSAATAPRAPTTTSALSRRRQVPYDWSPRQRRLTQSARHATRRTSEGERISVWTPDGSGRVRRRTPGASGRLRLRTKRPRS